jgi:hypothetical protein
VNEEFYFLTEKGDAIGYHGNHHRGPFLANSRRDAEELRDTLVSLGHRASVAQIGTVEGETVDSFIREVLRQPAYDCVFLLRRDAAGDLEYAAFNPNELSF